MTIAFDTEKTKLSNWEVYLLEFERQETTLSASASISATAVSAADVSDFPNQGYIKIGNEIICYSNKTGAVPGCFEAASGRGYFQTVPAVAASGAIVKECFDKFWASKVNLISGGLDISDDRAVLNFPKGLKATIEPDEGKSSIGEVSVELVDADHVVSKMLSIVPMRDRKVTLWAGYENLPCSAFQEEFVGIVKKWDIDSELRTYTLSISDYRRTYRNAIFRQIGKCKLTSAITNAATSIPVTSTDAASAGDRRFTNPASGYSVDTYLKIDDEIIGPVTAKSATGFTVSGRGAFYSGAAAHDDEADVNEIMVFDARNPIDLLLQVMTSTGATGTNGTYDVLPDHCGFAIDASWIDVTTFEAERDDWTSTYNVAFFIDATIDDGKGWLEQEILRLIGGYIITLRNGKLSLRMYHRQALADSTIVTTDDIVGKIKFDPSLPSIINQLLVEYSKKPTDGKYREMYEEINADSISRHGASPLMSVKFDGVHDQWSELDPLIDGYNLLADYASRILTRYANETPDINLRLRHAHRSINVGDLLAITHNDLPNFAPASGGALTGRGVLLQEYEVVGRKMVYDKNDSYVDIDAQRAIYSGGAVSNLNYIYQNYLSNNFQHTAGFVGVSLFNINSIFTLTANKIRFRVKVSKDSAYPTGLIRGVIKTLEGTIINSDATFDVSVLPAYPVPGSWVTFEFTIPPGAVGENINYLGVEAISGVPGYFYLAYSYFPSDPPWPGLGLYYISTHSTFLYYDNARPTCDLAEKLI